MWLSWAEEQNVSCIMFVFLIYLVLVYQHGRGVNFPLILRRLLDSICGTLHERFNKLFCSTRTTSDQVKWTHYRAGGGRWMALIRHQVYTPFSSSIESPPLFCLSLHKLQHLLILSESSSNHAFHVSTRASSTWGHRDAAQGWPGLHVGSRPALQLSHVGRGVQIISIHGLEAAVTPIKTSLGQLCVAGGVAEGLHGTIVQEGGVQAWAR